MRTVIFLMAFLSPACLDFLLEQLNFNYNKKNLSVVLAVEKSVILLKEKYRGIGLYIVDYNREEKLVGKYNVRGLSVFIFFNLDCSLTYKIEGFQKKNTLETYRNYSNNGSYSKLFALNKREIKMEKNRVIIKIHVHENFILWGRDIEVTINNISFEIINITPETCKIEDFETMIEARMHQNYTDYKNLKIEFKVAVWGESCCGDYREYILGLDFKRENLK
ncbi:hypothetical protein IPdc08_01661 [archaeon]|nr:hypothetical protein IPdc08_01661 [archaeon]